MKGGINMGFPNIPPINPNIDIDRNEIIDLLLASIGLEELSLAHLLNAEAEKLQRALGTLQIPGTQGDVPEDFFPELIGGSFDNLLAVNRSINKTLKLAMHKEFILLVKLEEVLELAEQSQVPPGQCCTNTIGYWRRVENVEEDIPLALFPFFLGTEGGTFTEQVDTPAEAAQIAGTTGGLYDQLRAQLMAAKLNIARCGIAFTQLPPAVQNAINQADEFLADNNTVEQGEQDFVSSLVDTLSLFNEGDFPGFPHCP